jgi:putative transposase
VTDESRALGYDAGKKVKDQKRHLQVGTLGLRLVVGVSATGVSDRAGGQHVWEPAGATLGRQGRVWADSAYRGELVAQPWVQGWLVLETADSAVNLTVFSGQRRHRVVERTFGWLNRYQWLSTDYEGLTISSEAWIQIAMINLMASRLAVHRRRP